MKKIIYSLVIMIAASTLFTSCLEYVEPVGIQQLRSAKADYLDALGQLRLADAELQKANAAYVNARAAYVDAQTEWQLIENRIHEYDVQIKAARTEYEVDSLTKLKELLQVQHDTGMANARAALAWAQENLRVTLRDIAAVQNLFTAGERTVFADVLGRYEAAFNAYNKQLNVVEQAKATLWELEYRLNDSTDWVVNFQGQVDFFAGEVDRAQAALEAVPEKLDLEDWKAEVDNLQDSIDAINYSRAALRRDSVNYMINTWCEANIGYEEEWKAAKQKYLDDLAAITPVANPGPKPADPGAEPVRADYDGEGDYTDSLALEVFEVTPAQWGSSQVYQKFADLIGLYAHTAAPVGVDSSTAFFWGTGTPADGFTAGIETNATPEMVNFLFGEEGVETPRTFTYKKGTADITLKNSRYIGLYGAHSVLDRYLVLTEGDELALKAAQKAAHDADSIYWAHRNILVAGKEGYQPLVDAIADSVLSYNALQQAKADAKARAQALVNAGKALANGIPTEGFIANYAFTYGLGTTPDNPVNVNDSINLINGIKTFATARWNFFEDTVAKLPANKPTNYFTARTKTDSSPFDVDLRDITKDGYAQRSGGWADHKIFSDFSFDRYKTEEGGLGVEKINRRPLEAAENLGWTPAVFDALLRTLNSLWTPGFCPTWDVVDFRFNDITQGVNFTEFNYYGYVYNDAQPYSFENSVGDPFIPQSVKDAEDAHTAAKAEVVAKEAEYEAIYASFWNQAYATPELPINWADETFTVPDELIIFIVPGHAIRWNERLGAVLSFLETDGAQPATYFRGVGDVLTNSNIFGSNPAYNTEYYKKLKAEFELAFILGGNNNIEALAKIKAQIDSWMDDIADARTVADEAAYKAAKTQWTADKAAYDAYPAKLEKYKTYVASVNALKEAFYGIEKYDAAGNPVFFTTDVPKIPTPGPGTYEVADIIKDWKYNTKYFGGKQLELAQKWHGDYPETLQGFDDRAYFITHTIYHLNTIKGVLDNAYTAAAKIYTYDWEKYTYTEPNNVAHEYKIKIEEMTQDLGANAAADFAAIVANYNAYQKQYKEAWEKYLEDCTGELGYWKKLLAQFEAGYNPIEMAVKLQRDKVAKAEEKLAIFQKALELAEAEYQAIIDQLLK
jgi:predicted  nucleic acid-binding Zn-ribbon protein